MSNTRALKRLNDKIQGVNQYAWNQYPLVVEDFGSATPAVVIKSNVYNATIEDLKEAGLIVFYDHPKGLVVY